MNVRIYVLILPSYVLKYDYTTPVYHLKFPGTVLVRTYIVLVVINNKYFRYGTALVLSRYRTYRTDICYSLEYRSVNSSSSREWFRLPPERLSVCLLKVQIILLYWWFHEIKFYEEKKAVKSKVTVFLLWFYCCWRTWMASFLQPQPQPQTHATMCRVILGSYSRLLLWALLVLFRHSKCFEFDLLLM